MSEPIIYDATDATWEPVLQEKTTTHAAVFNFGQMAVYRGDELVAYARSDGRWMYRIKDWRLPRFAPTRRLRRPWKVHHTGRLR